MASALIDASALAALFGRNPIQTQKYDELLALASLEHWALATTWPCVAKACALIAPPGRFALLDFSALMKRHTQPPKDEAGQKGGESEMDLAEASLYRLAVETGVTRIMTLDGLDFARYRLPDGRQFEIL